MGFERKFHDKEKWEPISDETALSVASRNYKDGSLFLEGIKRRPMEPQSFTPFSLIRWQAEK